MSEPDERDDEALRALLKGPLSAEPPPSLLPGVQRRIRRRSRGKFFADGWSTTESRLNHALLALLMLLVVVATYVALGPMGISAP